MRQWRTGFTDTGPGRTENHRLEHREYKYIFLTVVETSIPRVITNDPCILEITKGDSGRAEFADRTLPIGLKQLLDPASPWKSRLPLYLVSPGGQLIYHPQMQLIDAGQMQENFRLLPVTAMATAGGVLSGRDPGCNGQIGGLYRPAGNLVGVTPEKLSEYVKDQVVYKVFLIALFLFMLMIINASISSALPSLIREAGKISQLWPETGTLDVEVYQGGSYEDPASGTFHR